MRQYTEATKNVQVIKRTPAHFTQGFWLGVAFGTLGAVVMLARHRRD